MNAILCRFKSRRPFDSVEGAFLAHDDVWSRDAARLLWDRKRALRPEAKNVKNVATAAQPTAPAPHKQAHRRGGGGSTLRMHLSSSKKVSE